ncbi:hypothetical protein PG984_004607 [Apiospora sp. TS-2023a]
MGRSGSSSQKGANSSNFGSGHVVSRPRSNAEKDNDENVRKAAENKGADYEEQLRESKEEAPNPTAQDNTKDNTNTNASTSTSTNMDSKPTAPVTENKE